MHIQEITAQKLPAELNAIVEQNYGRGIETVLVIDDITFRMEADGKTVIGKARGFSQDGKVYVKVNNMFTAEQINGHETFHVEAERFPEAYKQLQKNIASIVPQNIMEVLLEKSIGKHKYIYDADQITDLANEEILADIAGGMNPLANIPEVREAVGRFYDEIYGKGAGKEFQEGIDTSRYSMKEAAGKPAVFSLEKESDPAAEIMGYLEAEEGRGTESGPSLEAMIEEAAKNERGMSTAEEDAAASRIMEELTGEKIDGDSYDGIMREQEIRKRIQSDEFPKMIRQGQQNKHIEGTHEYEQYVQKFKDKGEYGPSRLTISPEEVERLIQKYSGKGKISIESGEWQNYEIIIDCDKIIGIVINNWTGQEVPTSVFKLHYSKYGIHMVPDYPSKGGNKK